jgi:hypothetical protein
MATLKGMANLKIGAKSKKMQEFKLAAIGHSFSRMKIHR